MSDVKTRTIELIIQTNLTDSELVEVFDTGTNNLKELGITLLEINIKNSASSLVKGIEYNNFND